MEDELVDALSFAKAHFALGGMDVHVHLFGRQVEEQHESRVALVVQDVLIGLAQSVAGDFVAHETPVDEEILRIPIAARIGGQGGEALQRKGCDLVGNIDCSVAELVAQQGRNAF